MTYDKFTILFCRFIVYKLPQIYSELTTSGADFMYMDAKKQTFKTSPIPLDKENQAIAHTLNQIYNNPRQVRDKCCTLIPFFFRGKCLVVSPLPIFNMNLK